MNVIAKATNFISEVKQELAKVSWSNRSELLGATSVVITITAIMAVFIGIVDLCLSGILNRMFR